MRPLAPAALLLILSVLTFGCTPTPEAGSGGTTETTDTRSGLVFPDTGPGVNQPQVLTDNDGELLFLWTDLETHDLFLAVSDAGAFEAPVRVNSVPGSMNPIEIDEMRPSIAVGPGGQIAVAWTDNAFDIQAAVSTDGGRSFGDSIRLNQDEGLAMQEFPAIAFDPAGVFHAVWLDPRIAPEGAEEPADLYYARLDGDDLTELNLTVTQESSVCGCCLPHLRVEADGSLTVTFRNTTDDGYRDPFQVRGSAENGFGSPERVSPPVWQIDFCPVAGPIAVNDMTLWLDARDGPRRLLSSFSVDQDPDVVLEDTDEQLLLLPPRRVAGLTRDFPVVLVPAEPASYLLTPIDHSWIPLFDDLPWWVTSATMYQEDLVLVGVMD